MANLLPHDFIFCKSFHVYKSYNITCFHEKLWNQIKILIFHILRELFTYFFTICGEGRGLKFSGQPKLAFFSSTYNPIRSYFLILHLCILVLHGISASLSLINTKLVIKETRFLVVLDSIYSWIPKYCMHNF